MEEDSRHSQDVYKKMRGKGPKKTRQSGSDFSHC